MRQVLIVLLRHMELSLWGYETGQCYYLYLTGSMSIFSNNNNKVIKTVPIAAMMFMNFCALTLLLNTFSIALNIINPIIPPEVLVIISVISKAPTLKIN